MGSGKTINRKNDKAEQQGPCAAEAEDDEEAVRFTALPLIRFIASRRGDMVWHALIIITVLLPLASLSIDIPRYFVLKSRLQLAADGAAEAAAQRVDTAHFRDTGEVRLAGDAYAQAVWAAAALLPMHERGYTTGIERFQIDEQADTVTVGLAGRTRLFFGLSPAIRVRAEALSRFRMAQR